MSENASNAQLIADASIEDRIYLFEDVIPIGLTETNEGQKMEVLADAIEAWEHQLPHPRRHRGCSGHDTLHSLIAHIKRYARKETTIWVDSSFVCAVYNDHSPENAGWLDFSARMELRQSEAFETWIAGCRGHSHSQDELANLIDKRLDDIANGAEMLEFVKNITINSKATYSRSINPQTGEHSLIARTEHGEGTTKIPRSFLIRIPLYKNFPTLCELEVRLSVQLANGRAMFSLAIPRLEQLFDAALAGLIETLRETGFPVFQGRP